MIKEYCFALEKITSEIFKKMGRHYCMTPVLLKNEHMMACYEGDDLQLYLVVETEQETIKNKITHCPFCGYKVFES